MAVTIAFYEGSQPRWVLGTASAGNDVTIPVRWTTGVGLCPSCSGGSVTAPPSQPAGNVRLRIASGLSTTGTVDTSIIAPSGARWDRSNLPIVLLTEP